MRLMEPIKAPVSEWTMPWPPKGVAWFLRGAHRRISKNHDKGFTEYIPRYGEKCGGLEELGVGGAE
ncbi:MAG: hypothetical protein LBQ88_13540 [Treponema sp.]|nr:hypothetical protein [Treponema sp.]